MLGDFFLELLCIDLTLRKALRPEDLPLFLLVDFRYELLLVLLGPLVSLLKQHQLSSQLVLLGEGGHTK